MPRVANPTNARVCCFVYDAQYNQKHNRTRRKLIYTFVSCHTCIRRTHCYIICCGAGRSSWREEGIYALRRLIPMVVIVFKRARATTMVLFAFFMCVCVWTLRMRECGWFMRKTFPPRIFVIFVSTAHTDDGRQDVVVCPMMRRLRA